MSKEIDVKIQKFQKLVDDDRTQEEERTRYMKVIEKLESQKEGSGGEKKPATKKKTGKSSTTKKKGKSSSEKKEDKPAPKKKDDKKKASSKKKKKGVKVISSKRVSIDGKEVAMDSQEFCDYLLNQFKQRREKSKSSGKKKKTTSVMSRVSSNIEKGITQAIKGGLKDKKDEIEKNPKKFINKVEKLETSTKSFLQDLKSVMGSEYDSKEVTSTVKSINDMIDELKKKLDDKKDSKK